ncbi:MAG: AAA family ATPase [Rhodococcus sp. (in: high G+C Gram-positive bacteria)]
MSKRPFVTRVRLSNYKSIKTCDVRLRSLAILVGPNGTGKSNFLDSLRFTSEALTTTLDHALRERGGINEVRRRSGGHPTNFTIAIDLDLGEGRAAGYEFEIGAVKGEGFRVKHERCWIDGPLMTGHEPASFEVTDGQLTTNLEERLPAPSPDRLFLVNASNVDAFRPVYDALTKMGFYNLSPAAIRQPQPPDPGTLLRRDGSNLASVLAHLEQRRPDVLERVVEYLRLLAPGITSVRRISAGPMETIEFRQGVQGAANPWKFAAINMSDGTLRGLGVLVAMLQAVGGSTSLIGIEEPEVALHPAAVGVIVDAIRDASLHTQLVVTSHSPDLLDRNDLLPEELVAVRSEEGITEIGPLNEFGRSALKNHMFTPGELMRMNELQPDPGADLEQSELFAS